MLSAFATSLSRRPLAAVVTMLSLPALVCGAALAQTKAPAAKAPEKAAKAADKPAKMDEVTVTVKRVKALDKIDVGGGAPDLFARVTIAGEALKSPVAKQQTEVKPDWKLTKSVPRGKTAIKLEILDKDVLNPSDAIDINRVDKKRDLDFTVNTDKCRIEGLSGSNSCGSKISRAGRENKKAEIDFTVTVKKGK